MRTTSQRQETEKAIHATLDDLGFAATNPRNGCRDHAASAVRVQFMTDDERCAIYAFDGKFGGLLSYEISLPYAAPLGVIRAAITTAVGADRVSPVVEAARALLEAREDQMVTQAEWDRLQTAVAANAKSK